MQTQTTLTAPWDRTQLQNAVEANVISFPIIDKYYNDPIYNGQLFCLHSFVPTKGAKPDEKGVYGFMKCRGAFQTLDEANQRAEWLIQNVDSYHKILTGRCGKPFPVCEDAKKFCQETETVDIQKHAVKTISQDIKDKRLQEQKEIEDIKEREERLLKESKMAQEDIPIQNPIEQYTTLQVKKANLLFTYVKTMEKMAEMRRNIRKAYFEIAQKDKEDESLYNQYYEHYMKARKDANIPDIDPNENENWLKYMCEDAVLDFDPRQPDEEEEEKKQF